MVLTTFLAIAAMSQQTPLRSDVDRAVEAAKPNGWYVHYQGSASWDPKTVISFEGRVSGVIQSENSVDLMVKLKNGGTAFVELGPKEYFDAQALHVSTQDSVKVRGSKVMVNGESLVLCQELRQKGSKIAFRTNEGRPFWTMK